MAYAGAILWSLHAAIALLLAIHSLAYLGLALSRLRVPPTPPTPTLVQTPGVTIQVVVRDEPDQLEACVTNLQRLDWPRQRLEIQILDDSKDPRHGRRCADALRRAGIETQHVHRTQNVGEKAGALQAGLRAARWDVLVPLDVDFRPTPDFLHAIVPHLSDPTVACVQTRWSSSNRRRNLLTGALDVGMSGHFRVEQTVRAHHGGLTSFNATACAWRRSDIEAAGGWPAETLTEDLDLATRVRLRGRRFVYLEDVGCPAEVPGTVSALAVQQSRWARGSLHCLRLHGRSVLRSPHVPRRRRPGVLFHLGHYSLQPLILASFAVQAMLVLVQPTPQWYAALSILPLLLGPLAMYLVALWLEAGVQGWLRLVHLPTLALVGLGLVPAMSLHAVQGLRGRRGRFRRTPKEGARARRAGHRLPALVTAALGLTWTWFAHDVLLEPLAAGVVLFAASALVAALLP